MATDNKLYESLYQKTKNQDRSKVFAYFWHGDDNDPWYSCRKLVELAQIENWESFEEREDGLPKFPRGNLQILSSYLNYTFMRLQEEGKVLVANTKDRACFNTGLLDRRFGEDIYAFFNRNCRGQGFQDWCFQMFCTRSEAMRQNLLKGFGDFPLFAEYYNRANYRDLFFDFEYEKIVLSPHILDDRAFRFPRRLPRDLNVLYGLIQGAVQGLYARLRRNYKLAVPHWHDGHIQLLLPLCLADSSKADLALLVERNDEQKCYFAKTILTMDMAYQDARLICRPDSDWLRVNAAE